MGQGIIHVDRIGGHFILCLRRHIGVGAICQFRGPTGHRPGTDLVHQALQLTFRSCPVGQEIVLVKGGVVQAGNGVGLGIQGNILDLDPSIGRNQAAGGQRSSSDGSAACIKGDGFPERRFPRIAAVQDHLVVPGPQGDLVIQFQGIVSPLGIAFSRLSHHQVVVAHADGAMLVGFRLGLVGRFLDCMELAAVHRVGGISPNGAGGEAGDLPVPQIDARAGIDHQGIDPGISCCRGNGQTIPSKCRSKLFTSYSYLGQIFQFLGQGNGQTLVPVANHSDIPCGQFGSIRSAIHGQSTIQQHRRSVPVIPFELQSVFQGCQFMGAGAFIGIHHPGHLLAVRRLQFIAAILDVDIRTGLVSRCHRICRLGPFQDQMAGLGGIGAAGCLGLQDGHGIGDGAICILGPQRKGPASHILFPVNRRGHRPVSGFCRRRGQVGRGIVLCQCGPICQIGPLDLGRLPQGQGLFPCISSENDPRIRQRLTLGFQVTHGSRIVVGRIRIQIPGQSAGHMLDLVIPGTDFRPGELGGGILAAQAEPVRRQHSRLGLGPGLAVSEFCASEPGEHRAQADGVLGLGRIRLVIGHHADVGFFLHSGQKALDDASVLDAGDHIPQFPFRSCPAIHQLGGAGIAGVGKAGDGVSCNIMGCIRRTVQIDIPYSHAPGLHIAADQEGRTGDGASCPVHGHCRGPRAKGSSPLRSIQSDGRSVAAQGHRIFQAHGVVLGTVRTVRMRHVHIPRSADGGMFLGFCLGLFCSVFHRVELAAIHRIRRSGRNISRLYPMELPSAQVQFLGRQGHGVPAGSRGDGQPIPGELGGKGPIAEGSTGKAGKILGQPDFQLSITVCHQPDVLVTELGQIVDAGFSPREGQCFVEFFGHCIAAVPGKGHAGTIQTGCQIADIGRIVADVLVGGKELAAVHGIGTVCTEISGIYICYFLAIGMETIAVDIGLRTHLISRSRHPAAIDLRLGTPAVEGGICQARQALGQFHRQSAVATGDYAHIALGQFPRIGDIPRNAQGTVQGQGVGRTRIPGKGIAVTGQGHQMGVVLGIQIIQAGIAAGILIGR